MLTLTVTDGPLNGATVEASPGGSWVVGRQAEWLRLPDPRASRRHAEITQADDVWRVADLGSTNGTYVNSQRILGPTEIGEGDVIRIGRTHMAVSMMLPTPVAPIDTPAPIAAEPPTAAAEPSPMDQPSDALEGVEAPMPAEDEDEAAPSPEVEVEVEVEAVAGADVTSEAAAPPADVAWSDPPTPDTTQRPEAPETSEPLAAEPEAATP
ncbi:MAG: FHA domain-containing protein, partial [Planctomycetota bacterium]